MFALIHRKRGRKSDPVARVTQHKRLIKLDMWLMTHYPCNYTKIRTTQRTTPRRSGHDQMEAQAMHALQRHPARQMATMHTDRCGAASSRPTRTTSTQSPEALLRCTHASRLQKGQPRALAAAMSCEHRCDRKGRNSVRSGLQHGHGQGCDWCWTVGFERKGTWLRECTASRLL